MSNDNNIADPLAKAKELGSAIINSKEFTDLKEAEKIFMNDPEAAFLIDRFELRSKEYQSLTKENDPNGERAKKILKEISDVQEKINENEILDELYKCQKAYDKLVEDINDIVDYMTGNTTKGKSKNGCGGCTGCGHNG